MSDKFKNLKVGDRVKTKLSGMAIVIEVGVVLIFMKKN